MKNNHFEEDYNKLVQQKLATDDRAKAMADSIGGNFYHFGQFQKQLLLQHGLTESSSVLDLGCGSGRLANALKDMPELSYVGIDVVQELLDYANEVCQREGWQYIKSTDLSIPLADNSVDIVTAFSLFTHLLHEESFAYLAEVRRVLKPEGKIIFSFLDFDVPEHWTVFVSNLMQIDNRVHLNQFMGVNLIKIWAKHLQMEVQAIYPGDQPYIELPEPIESTDGVVYSGKVSLGQSVCILQKPKTTDHQILTKTPTDFDPDAYLAMNPDVAEAKIDPAVHFIASGQFENRKWR